MTSIADLRREYARARLDERDVSHDPLVEFARWFAEYREVSPPEPNAMILATATSDGVPSVRTVLLKIFDARGFVFFTDYRSRKGEELEANPRAALLFYWGELERQVRITGAVSRTSIEESEQYFRRRPLGSRLGAWSSHQSQLIAGRGILETALAETEAKFAHRDPPLPSYWGGFRITPDSYEFWQGRPNRLHDRIVYLKPGDDDDEPKREWRIARLSP